MLRDHSLVLLPYVCWQPTAYRIEFSQLPCALNSIGNHLEPENREIVTVVTNPTGLRDSRVLHEVTRIGIVVMSQDRTSPRFVDIKELSQQSGLSVSTITRLKNAGRIPFFQPGGKRSRVVFPIDAIEAASSPVTPPLPVAEPPHRSPDRRKGPAPRWKKRLNERDAR